MRQANIKPENPGKGGFDYIRWYYGVPARVGGRVFFGYRYNLEGTITGADRAYVAIRLNGHKKAELFHPTWELDYLGGDDDIKLADVSAERLSEEDRASGFAVFQFSWGYGVYFRDQVLGATLRKEPAVFIQELVDKRQDLVEATA